MTGVTAVQLHHLHGLQQLDGAVPCDHLIPEVNCIFHFVGVGEQQGTVAEETGYQAAAIHCSDSGACGDGAGMQNHYSLLGSCVEGVFDCSPEVFSLSVSIPCECPVLP